MAVGFVPTLYRSDDGGSSWSPLSGIGLPPYTSALTVDPSSTQVLYAFSSSGVSRSSDGGETWAVFSDIFEEPLVDSLLVSPDGKVLHAGTGDAVYDYTFCEGCPPTVARRPAPRPIPPRAGGAPIVRSSPRPPPASRADDRSRER